MDSKKKCDWFDKLKGFNQIIYLTPEVKKMLNLKDCTAKIAMFNENTNELMYENE